MIYGPNTSIAFIGHKIQYVQTNFIFKVHLSSKIVAGKPNDVLEHLSTQLPPVLTFINIHKHFSYIYTI